MAWRQWRAAAQSARVQPGARNETADERDEEQQVDRREPRGGEHVEQRQLVEQRSEVRVRGEEVVDLDRVEAALREQRSGDRTERKQREKQQRCAHAGEPTPA